MNFFKSKEPDIVEISREKRVKEGIIAELSACLKSIQATQLARRPGEPIYTCDSSNQLCTVLEAAFLHGHKSTRGIKRQQSDAKAFTACSFWTFVQRMTHKDTIGRLKSLTYTKTETGVCRAWIRMAVNDGLMESYLSTILAQPGALSQYYSSTALLRDIEQPGILLKLIQVLAAANYDFQLVYNSSQLNVWGVKTLTLAGLVERQVAHGSVSGVISNTSSPRSRSSTLDMEDVPDSLFSSVADSKRGDVFYSRDSSLDSNPFSSADNIVGRGSLSGSNSDSSFRNGEITSTDLSSSDQQTSGSHQQTASNCRHAGDSHQLTADSHQLTADSHTLTADSHTLTAGSLQLTADSHTLTADDHQLTDDSYKQNNEIHQLTEDSHQSIYDSHQLTADSHTLTADDHQLIGDSHQSTAYSHTLTGASHQLTDDSYPLTADSHEQITDTHQLTDDTRVSKELSSTTDAQLTNHVVTGSQLEISPSHSPSFQRSSLDAERELARLRTASYRISDIIDLTVSAQDDELNNDLESSVPALSVHQISPAPELFGLPQELRSPATYEEAVSSSTSSADSSSTSDIAGEPYGAVGVDSSQDGAVYPPSDPPIISPNEHAGNPFTDQPEALFADQSQRSPAAKFVFGTPLSQPEYLPCTEPTAHESEDEATEEEMAKNPFLQGELTPTVSSASAESSYTNYPLSAAQAILSRAHPQVPQANSYATLTGNSVGSHGNSLASLSGWGGAEETLSDSKAAEIEPVQSYADLISGYKQAEEQVFGSPIREYTVDPAVLASSSVTIKPAEQLPAAAEPTAAALQPAAFEQTVSTDDSESFEVVKKSDEEGILSQYGRLCSEEGLLAQDYKCHMCRAPVGIIYGQPRVCSYTKKYYCSECHINEESFVPAKIVFNWDWAKYSVCKHSKEFLTSAEAMPLLDIQQLNPRLYEHVPVLDKMKLLRTELFYLKRYLFACHPTVAEELKQRFWPKEYIYEEIHTYSVQDLLSINANSSLANQMKKAIKSARKHVQGCESCEYRGFLCEICGSPQVIFPFDLDITSRCERCSAVYHKACMTVECPKCRRIQQREALLSKTAQDQTLADNLDYSLPQT